MWGYSIKNKFQFSLALMLIFFLFGCNKSNETGLFVSGMEAWIDPDIQGEERIIISQILAALPEEA